MFWLRTPQGLVEVAVDLDETTREVQRFRVTAPRDTGLRIVMRVGASQTEVARPLPVGTDKVLAVPAGWHLRDGDDPLFEPWWVAVEST